MDIHCVVCGEEWNAWGVNHGDMMAWETDLFRLGAGCPSCEGKKQEEPWEPKDISDLDNGDEDPYLRIVALDDAGKLSWEEPSNEVIKKCDGCGIELVRASSEEVYDGSKREKVYSWNVPYKSKASMWYVSHSKRNMGPAEDAVLDDADWHPFGEGSTVCPCCQTTCSDCGVKIAVNNDIVGNDMYAQGYNMLRPGCYHVDDAICTECYSKYCSECENHFEQCSCNETETEPETEDDET